MFNSKKENLFQKNLINYSLYIHLINQYSNYLLKRKDKNFNKIYELGIELGQKMYEVSFFGTKERYNKRDLKALDGVKSILTLWTFLFYSDKSSKGSYTKPDISTFTGERSEKLNPEKKLKEYEICDNNPPYLSSNKDNKVICKLLSGIIKGFLDYNGFLCDVEYEIQNEPNNIKCSFIVMFTEEVLKDDI